MRLPDLAVFQPKLFSDERGYFFEAFNQRTFESAVDRSVTFVQDNQSLSLKGVLRGLHYQLPPHPQGKLVRCVQGVVWDVAVDIRRSSPTFSQWYGIELTAQNRKQLWIPEGFAHGFVALSDEAIVAYKTTDYYAPDCDRSIRWSDPAISVAWPVDGPPLVSPKDESAPLLVDAEVFE